MEDIFTVRVYLALFGLAFLTILPALISRWQERTSSKTSQPPLIPQPMARLTPE